MKKYYYFSKTKLKFIEINGYHRKFIALVTLTSLIASFFLFGIYLILGETISPDAHLKNLQSENRLLKNELLTVHDKLVYYSGQFDSLANINNDLRLANNLEPITDEDINLGSGGAIFNRTDLFGDSEITDIISSLDNFVESIEFKIKLENESYNEIQEALINNNELFDAIPAIRPTTGSYGDRFGLRHHPILKIKRMHNGVDFLTYYNTPVYAPGGGKVEFAGRKGGYGKTLVINHGFGYKTVYAHLNKFKVKVGQKIKRGDLIALTGSSGSLSTGPHLHYEVKHNGIALNPRNFIFDDVKIFELANNINKE
jgi:murein DD-endopeptidase MepM/ murein hydrolase activator NlpD